MGLVVYDFFSHVLAFDLPWIVSFIGQNIFWLVAFFVGASILTQGKPFKSNLLWLWFTALVVWTSADLGFITGWTFYIPSFLAIHLIVRMTTVFFTESIPALKKYFSGVLVFQAVITLTFFYIYVYNFT